VGNAGEKWAFPTLGERSAGIRAQALDVDGNLVDDFRITRRGAVLAVRNAPSPAATSSMAIAEHLVDVLLRR
jgi:L-2-hydroxyglutarate oxidase LhgO